jgi:hypothetical protein
MRLAEMLVWSNGVASSADASTSSLLPGCARAEVKAWPAQANAWLPISQGQDRADWLNAKAAVKLDGGADAWECGGRREVMIHDLDQWMILDLPAWLC